MTHRKAFKATYVTHTGRKDRAKGERTERMVGLSIMPRYNVTLQHWTSSLRLRGDNSAVRHRWSNTIP